MPRDQPWDVPPQPDEKIGELRWKATPEEPQRIMSLRFLYGIVRAGSKVFGWPLVVQLDVHDDEGEHTPLYLKAFRWAKGALWGITIEVRDWAGRGALWGAEILLMSKGRDRASVRRGLGIVLGTIEGAEKAYYDFGVDVLPRGGDPASAHVGTAFNCSVPCDVFARVPVGVPVYMSTDIYFVFKNTGYIEWWVEGAPTPAMALQMSWNQLFVGGKRVLTEP